MRTPEYSAATHPRRARPGPDPGGEPSWGPRAALAVTAAATVLGISLLLGGAEEGPQTGPPQPENVGQASPAGPTATAAALPPAAPTWISIPAIGVNAPLTAVGMDAEGWIEAPPEQEANLAGWFQDAPTPGAAGTSVVVGHVDNDSGPAVFYGLGSLAPGDAVEVTREDGRTVRFTVYDVAVYDKENLPRHVYRDTVLPELRVITCGGGFDQETGYDGNVVVFARMTGSR